jgi:anti-sigma factor RsiW
MSCRELVEVVTDYIEGAMGDADRRRFEAHLRGCAHCVNYVEQMRATIAALGRLDEDSFEPEKREELLEAFRGWRQSEPL